MNSDKNDEINSLNKINIIFQDGNKNNMHNTHSINIQTDNTATDKKKPKDKVTITVDEDDPCLQQEKEESKHVYVSFGEDPRFQQQNQTLRCWVMYTDFHRCKNILGAETDACNWFKQVYTSICANEWIYRWNKLKAEGKLRF
ncbi:PREDICTED: cytochrome c oxidase subunit 6B1-like [Eufriesea mexicana]|uniref:cytochrome c oxidase subunit 6B1-like n=1 Tax=Eufriesea mexicana TaxID=516756 RepID=UPI00083BDCB0|nr:PREDICTED: cytochrome c oxidase subunit 6B1-like [Eufriesea mexicana]